LLLLTTTAGRGIVGQQHGFSIVVVVILVIEL
jgi:hypothetical protein